MMERIYTSTATKLIRNHEKIKEIKEGKLRPQSLQLSPTDVCNLHCPFCSVWNRPQNELKWDTMKDTIDALKDMGLKTVEITGGGEPTMYKDINDLICIITDGLFNLKCGLITNGTNLKALTQKSLERLTWIRISMNCLEQVSDIEIPKLPDTCTLGFSFVWDTDKTSEQNKKLLDKIEVYSKKYKAKYIRVVPNCLSTEHIAKARKEVPKMIKEIPNAFFQSKEYSAHDKCFMGYLKPFLYTDGYFYHCSANPLIDRKFNEHFRMGHCSEVREIWRNPKPFPTEKCGLCFFAEQNRLIEDLMTKREHEEFL